MIDLKVLQPVSEVTEILKLCNIDDSKNLTIMALTNLLMILIKMEEEFKYQ